MDAERLGRISEAVSGLRSQGVDGFLVFESTGTVTHGGVDSWGDVMQSWKGDPQEVLTLDPHIHPEDNATIIFTSGT